ncbi:MAG: hypothetical protein MI919_38490 [Holophagales bacterium]|nr:hypothetical protein [Holophagales bacterium]
MSRDRKGVGEGEREDDGTRLESIEPEIRELRSLCFGSPEAPYRVWDEVVAWVRASEASPPDEGSQQGVLEGLDSYLEQILRELRARPSRAVSVQRPSKVIDRLPIPGLASDFLVVPEGSALARIQDRTQSLAREIGGTEAAMLAYILLDRRLDLPTSLAPEQESEIESVGLPEETREPDPDDRVPGEGFSDGRHDLVWQVVRKMGGKPRKVGRGCEYRTLGEFWEQANERLGEDRYRNGRSLEITWNRCWEKVEAGLVKPLPTDPDRDP